MAQLFSALCDGRYAGRPILVIGGGPSAKADLLKIPLDYPACVISANEHGFKQDRFKVDFIVSVDWLYGGSKIPMSDFLRQFGTPTINRWSWAHYRIPEFSFCGDSGLTAIVVATMLGGHPVIPLGMDRYLGDRRYFWQDVPEHGWGNRRAHGNVDHIRQTTEQCVDFTRDSQVRMFDGPMRAYWPALDMLEHLPKYVPCGAPQCTLEGKTYRIASEPIFIHPTDRIDSGTIVLTKNEAHPHLHFKKIVET